MPVLSSFPNVIDGKLDPEGPTATLENVDPPPTNPDVELITPNAVRDDVNTPEDALIPNLACNVVVAI
jgi:hypothetical protein